MPKTIDQKIKIANNKETISIDCDGTKMNFQKEKLSVSLNDKNFKLIGIGGLGGEFEFSQVVEPICKNAKELKSVIEGYINDVNG